MLNWKFLLPFFQLIVLKYSNFILKEKNES